MNLIRKEGLKLKEKNVFVLLYLGLLLVSLLVNSIIFWREEHLFWSISGGLFALLILFFIIGYLTNRRSFLWIGVFSISTYSAYAIGALIWSIFSHTFHIFIIIFVIFFVSLNLLILLHTKEKFNLIFKK